MSGGQVQRILLARALYKTPQILLLDEASSHLDVQTEWKINQALKNLSLTTVIVAHRPQTVLLADRIYQLTTEGLVAVSHQAIRDSLAKNGNMIA